MRGFLVDFFPLQQNIQSTYKHKAKCYKGNTRTEEFFKKMTTYK